MLSRDLKDEILLHMSSVMGYLYDTVRSTEHLINAIGDAETAFAGSLQKRVEEEVLAVIDGLRDDVLSGLEKLVKWL